MSKRTDPYDVAMVAIALLAGAMTVILGLAIILATATGHYEPLAGLIVFVALVLVFGGAGYAIVKINNRENRRALK